PPESDSSLLARAEEWSQSAVALLQFRCDSTASDPALPTLQVRLFRSRESYAASFAAASEPANRGSLLHLASIHTAHVPGELTHPKDRGIRHSPRGGLNTLH